MNTLAIIAQKGGAGKTTLTVHIAVYAAMQGLTVAIIDIDPQASAYRWNESRPAEKQFSAIKADAVSLPGLLAKAQAGGIDLAIIDTQPHSSHEATVAAQAADFALLPCRPQRWDLEAMAPTIGLMQLTKTPFAVALNAAPQGFKLAEEARSILQSTFGVTVLPTIIHQQAALSHAVFDGRSVHEFDPKSRAATEIAAVYDELANVLGLRTPQSQKALA